MLPLSSVSRAAEAAGIPARYCYWTGRSGRRYLFTRTDAASAGDFAEAVALLVSGGAIVWSGEVAALAAAGHPGGTVYLHLLAATADDRRAVIDDLRPRDRQHLRLAA